MQHLTHSTCLVDYTCYKWEVDWRMLCAHRRLVARHFASSWRCSSNDNHFNDIRKNGKSNEIVGYIWKSYVYVYIYTHTIYKHHISPFFRSGFASLVEPSFRFVLTLLHFAFFLQTPCFSAATARTAPPCGAGASPQNDAKSHRNHWNYYELSLIIINYHEKISLS